MSTNGQQAPPPKVVLLFSIYLLCIYPVNSYMAVKKFNSRKAVFVILLIITPTVIDKTTPNFTPDKITCFHMLYNNILKL
jgi:hypothetical protein